MEESKLSVKEDKLALKIRERLLTRNTRAGKEKILTSYNKSGPTA